MLLMDIGGWTVGLMRLVNGIPNASACRSLELGMIRCIDEAKEQVRRETGLSVTDAQVERVLAGQSCSMDENARSVIQKQGRIYTEALLSAAMEAGFDLKAVPAVMLGGGASVIQRGIRPQDGLRRFFTLLDDKVNRRVRADFGPVFGRCEQEMSRPRFSFRPNLQNEEHRKAWVLLQSVPEGQCNTFIARAILENVRQDTLESTLRRVLREELRAFSVQTEARTGGKTEVHDNKLSLKVTRLTREIEQTLNQRQVEPGKALSLILECAAEKYRVCQMGRLDHRTGNIQDQLKGHSEDREMDRQLFSQIIEKVILEPKGSVKLQLINEKII